MLKVQTEAIQCLSLIFGPFCDSQQIIESLAVGKGPLGMKKSGLKELLLEAKGKWKINGTFMVQVIKEKKLNPQLPNTLCHLSPLNQ